MQRCKGGRWPGRMSARPWRLGRAGMMPAFARGMGEPGMTADVASRAGSGEGRKRRAGEAAAAPSVLLDGFTAEVSAVFDAPETGG